MKVSETDYQTIKFYFPGFLFIYLFFPFVGLSGIKSKTKNTLKRICNFCWVFSFVLLFVCNCKYLILIIVVKHLTEELQEDDYDR